MTNSYLSSGLKVIDVATAIAAPAAPLGDELEVIIANRTSDEWLATFEPFDIPVNRVAIVEDLPTDEQILANDMAVAKEHLGVPLLLNHPIRVTSVPLVEPQLPPAHGEHAAEIQGELGYDGEAIERLEDLGVN